MKKLNEVIKDIKSFPYIDGYRALDDAKLRELVNTTSKTILTAIIEDLKCDRRACHTNSPVRIMYDLKIEELEEAKESLK